jgi:TrkA-N domain
VRKLVGYGTLATLTLILGFWGFAVHLDGRFGFWDILYFDLQLFVLSSEPLKDGGQLPVMLQVARFAAPATTAYAIISAVLGVLNAERRELTIRWSTGHDVVCGDGRPALLLARWLREEGRRVILLGLGMGPDLVEACLSEGIHFVDAEPGGIEALRRAAVQRADTLYAVSQENAANVASTVLAHQLTLTRHKPLRCYVAIGDPDLRRALIARFLGTPSPTRLELNIYNEIELAAHVLLEQAGLSQDVMVIGLGELGQAVVNELLHRWQGHFRLTGEPLRLSLVDEDAPRIWALMKAHGRFRHESCEVRLVPVASRPLRNSTLARPVAPDWWTSPERAFVCVTDIGEALAIGLGIVGIGRFGDTRVTVCVDRYGDELREVFQGLSGIPVGRLSVFSARDAAWTPSFIRDGVAIERIARSLHQRYIEKRLTEGDIDDRRGTLCTWERLPERYRESNRDQARHIGRKLDLIGCYLLPVVDEDGGLSFDMTPDEVEGLARAEHVRWMAERAREEADHPDMVGWDLLPEPAREKDRVFARAIPDVLADIGFRVMRKTV